TPDHREVPSFSSRWEPNFGLTFSK
uniref:Attacin (Fragments) n=1 Tax=Heliothis virescens TaxID=7102 RepID=ATT_HELVI|nr:RecName: Full=Attacin [Heliothis virescens]